ncbi:uncharacterized protein ColSpa_04075 [Colletotrichum spaethianum]|uniref:Uncharacterized protein n=1 Tax=Colletotrichum spaethianum TaxID=700344 RepID=A0AA37P7H2_9PEZI|nr:uncharacterized protein ColSpa_04075 [Colletotrichum spaethianum]GKT43894.1 hypothetical protein ColSpa_04075 [Colletotrichum spaethianum]
MQTEVTTLRSPISHDGPRPSRRLGLVAEVTGNPLAGGARRLEGLRRRGGRTGPLRSRAAVLAVVTSGATPVKGSATGHSAGWGRAVAGATRGGLGGLTLTPAGLVAGEVEAGRATGTGAVARLGTLHRRGTSRGRASGGHGVCVGGGGGLGSGLALAPLSGTGQVERATTLGAGRLGAALGHAGRRCRPLGFSLGLTTGESLLLASRLEGSLLQAFLALLLALLLEALHLGSLGLGALLLLLLFLGGTLLGLAQDSLLLLALALLAELALAVLLLAGSNLLLQLPLGVSAALLELVAATLVEVGAERLVLGHETGKAVLELDALLVLDLGLLQRLGLDSLVRGAVLLNLLLVVFAQLLGLFLSERTLQVVNTLPDDAELLVDIVLLALELLQLDCVDRAGVKIVEVLQVQVDSLGANLEVGNLLLQLLLTDPVALGLHTLFLALLLLGSETLVLGLLEQLLAETLLAGVLSLLASLGLGSLLLALLDNVLSGEDSVVLLFSASTGTLQGSFSSGDEGLVVAGVNVKASGVERLDKAGELRADDLRRSALETLDGATVGLSGTSSRSSVSSLGGRKDVVVEAEDTGGVVDGLVHLRELLEESGEDDLLKRQDVLLHLSIGTNLGQDGRDLLANGEGVEVDLEDVVEVANLRTSTLQHLLSKSVAEEASTGGSLAHAEKVGEASVLVLPRLIEVDHGAAGAGGANDGNGESGQQHERGGLLKVVLGSRGVVSLLTLSAGDNGGGLAQKGVVPGPGGGVEKVVLTDEEDTRELLVVVGHHDVLGGTLAEVEQSVDILNGAESLLPELELNGNVELLETSLQVTLEGVGIAQVDGVHLSRVLGSGLDMVAQQLAKSAELSLSGVLQAEVEGLHGRALVEDLETGIVAEDVEDGTVRLPKELEPRGDDGTVSTVAGLLAGDGGEEDGLGGFASLQIVDVGGGGVGLDARLDLVGLGLGGGDLLGGQLDELLQNQLYEPLLATVALTSMHGNKMAYLDGADVGVLADVLVLVQGILGQLSLLLLDGELNQQKHHRLQRRDGDISASLRGDVLVEEGQGCRDLVDADELVGALQDIFGFLVGWRRL